MLHRPLWSRADWAHQPTHKATSTVPKLLQRNQCSRQDTLFLAMDSMSPRPLLASSNSRYCCKH